jgi:hypothetical protein
MRRKHAGDFDGTDRLPGTAGDGQDRYGQQNSKSGGCHVGDRVRVMEAGRGRLRC